MLDGTSATPSYLRTRPLEPEIHIRQLSSRPSVARDSTSTSVHTEVRIEIEPSPSVIMFSSCEQLAARASTAMPAKLYSIFFIVAVVYRTTNLRLNSFSLPSLSTAVTIKEWFATVSSPVPRALSMGTKIEMSNLTSFLPTTSLPDGN